MVRAIPNGAQLYGSVRDIRFVTAERSELSIHVERADDVAGLPNLLARAVGHELTVIVKADVVRHLGLDIGAAITCRAERTGPRSVVAQPGSLSRR